MSRTAGDRLIRAGIGVAVAGMVLSLLAMLPLVSSVNLPSTFWWLAMSVGVGVGLVLVGLASKGRGRARLQVDAASHIG